MKLYLLEQKRRRGYDTYDSCVVCAENAQDAITIHPDEDYPDEYTWDSDKESISCTEIGEANDKQKRGVIIASFNAG